MRTLDSWDRMLLLHLFTNHINGRLRHVARHLAASDGLYPSIIRPKLGVHLTQLDHRIGSDVLDGGDLVFES